MDRPADDRYIGHACEPDDGAYLLDGTYQRLQVDLPPKPWHRDRCTAKLSDMDVAVTSLIAIAGTLLGSVATYLFQRRTLEQAERLSLERQLRERQVTACSEFARAVTDYRGGQTDRWHREREDANSAAHEEARLRSHRLRAVANQELFRLKILVLDDELIQAAEKALTGSLDLHRNTTFEEFEGARQKARDEIENFARLARRHVHLSFTGKELP